MSVKSLQTYILEIYPILLGKSFIINGKHLLPAIFKSLHRDQMRSEAELWHLSSCHSSVVSALWSTVMLKYNSLPQSLLSTAGFLQWALTVSTVKKQPDSMMLPPPCFIIGMLLLTVFTSHCTNRSWFNSSAQLFFFASESLIIHFDKL